MAGTYGRGSAASTSRAQAGEGGSAYEYGARSAESFLDNDERSALSKSTATAGAEDRTGSKKKRNKQKDARASAADQAGRLREVAGTRALQDFTKQGISHSKPWLQKASQGLIASQGTDDSASAEYGGKRTGFGAVGVEQARSVRNKLSGLSGQTSGDIDTSLLGSATDRNRASAQSQYGQFQTTDKGFKSFEGDRWHRDDRAATTRDFGTTTIADADRAYTGLSGGTKTVYDEDKGTDNANKAGKKKKDPFPLWQR